MTRSGIAGMFTFIMLSLAVSSSAVSQDKPLREQLIGMWALVSAENTSAEGKTLPFGPSPRGIAVLDANGRFVILNMSSTLPKVASNNRATATAEENKAIVSGSLGLYGTWSVNEGEKVLVWRVEASTFENWVGLEQKRPINSVAPDEMSWTNPIASTGSSARTLLIWRRIK